MKVHKTTDGYRTSARNTPGWQSKASSRVLSNADFWLQWQQDAWRVPASSGQTEKIILRSVAIEFSSHQSRSEPLLHAWLPMCWDLKQDMEMDLLASYVATKAHPVFL